MKNSLDRTFGCPVELTLTLLGGKWKTVLLAHLKGGPLRYAELRRRVPALSEKMLTQRLREMTELGLVHATRGTSGSARYALSARGRSLGAVLQAMYDAGERIAPDVGARFTLG